MSNKSFDVTHIKFLYIGVVNDARNFSILCITDCITHRFLALVKEQLIDILDGDLFAILFRMELGNNNCFHTVLTKSCRDISCKLAPALIVVGDQNDLFKMRKPVPTLTNPVEVLIATIDRNRVRETTLNARGTVTLTRRDDEGLCRVNAIDIVQDIYVIRAG